MPVQSDTPAPQGARLRGFCAGSGNALARPHSDAAHRPCWRPAAAPARGQGSRTRRQATGREAAAGRDVASAAANQVASGGGRGRRLDAFPVVAAEDAAAQIEHNTCGDPVTGTLCRHRHRSEPRHRPRRRRGAAAPRTRRRRAPHGMGGDPAADGGETGSSQHEGVTSCRRNWKGKSPSSRARPRASLPRVAEHLAAAGAAVVVNYASSKAGAEAVVNRIRQAGGEAVAVQADVSKPEDVRRLFAESKKAFGTLDILVNNAGVYLFASLEADQRRAFSQALRPQRTRPASGDAGGRQIFRPRRRQHRQHQLDSRHADAAEHLRCGPSASKAAVNAVTRSLAAELGAARSVRQRRRSRRDRDRGPACRRYRRQRFPGRGRERQRRSAASAGRKTSRRRWCSWRPPSRPSPRGKPCTFPGVSVERRRSCALQPTEVRMRIIINGAGHRGSDARLLAAKSRSRGGARRGSRPSFAPAVTSSTSG